MRPFLISLMLIGVAACKPGSGHAPSEERSVAPPRAETTNLAEPTPVTPVAVVEPREAKPVPTLRLIGTEPFWGGAIKDGKLHYDTLENPKGWDVPGQLSQQADQLSYTGALEGKPFSAEIKRKACSDSMSDRDYAYSVVIRWGSDTRQGCADTPEALAKQPRP